MIRISGEFIAVAADEESALQRIHTNWQRRRIFDANSLIHTSTTATMHYKHHEQQPQLINMIYSLNSRISKWISLMQNQVEYKVL